MALRLMNRPSDKRNPRPHRPELGARKARSLQCNALRTHCAVVLGVVTVAGAGVLTTGDERPSRESSCKACCSRP